jgi:hypothetical protein
VSTLRRGIALIGGLILVGLIIAPSADAAVSPWVFAAQPASAAVPAGRVFAGGAGAADGRSGVFFGGQEPGGGGNVTFADTWVNSAAGWTAKCGTTIAGATLPCGPGARSALGMASGPNGVLLYGGFAGQIGNGAPLGDLWQWNGSAWAPLCTALSCGPGGRAVLAMAGNGVQAVLYGGLGSQGVLDDTWVYDGVSWTQTCGGTLPISCGPGGLAGASMAWDGTHFVLFGGTTTINNTAPVADTWTFNGTTWVKACGSAPALPCGPPGRVFGAFAYAHDNPGGISGAILAEGGDLFSGTSATIYRDAWLWHAGSWTSLVAPWSGPPITFSGGNGGPPPGPNPLIGTLVSEPTSCSVLYLGTRPTGTANPAQTFDSTTFVGGRNRTGRGTPDGCTAPPPPPPSTAPAAAVRTTPVTPKAVASVSPDLPATGGNHLAGLTAVSIALIVVGAGAIALGRRAPARSPRH